MELHTLLQQNGNVVSILFFFKIKLKEILKQELILDQKIPRELKVPCCKCTGSEPVLITWRKCDGTQENAYFHICLVLSMPTTLLELSGINEESCEGAGSSLIAISQEVN